ncbi:serine--tRNA ligase [Labrys wisconsinensis]|uniref:Serine--tRNA ligase n=1 Tax=Labrys wisconsinensis TaxID=425677 RepID=A0ABU0J3C9_9HYPH|nr:serine--tRNA ligase [Labrys wisconsinensis]MDQ0468773.1 seryl-tRNA synthetase [Labrys wisconsinensis]
MYDVKWIRDNPGLFDEGLARRGAVPPAWRSEHILALEAERRAIVTRLQASQERRNAASKEIGQAKARKDEAAAQALMAEVAALKQSMPADEAVLRTADAALNRLLSEIPNLPADDVPLGADEHGNVERQTRYGMPRAYTFAPREHFEIGEGLGLMDFETAAKLSGARFVVLKRGLARLERAIGQYMLDTHVGEHGYIEVNPPLLVRSETMFGTAQLPKFRDDQFFAGTHDGVDGQYETAIDRIAAGAAASEALQAAREEANQRRLWLIPTAEVPLTNLVREAITPEEELPLRLTALSHCFRAEAGAAGRDTRGMIRQHQFQKVELVSITTPEESRAEHERMLACAEAVLKGLDLHYRVMTLCTGDMGFASQKTYDIEVWLPGQGAFREISSCSVCGDFQARRMNARYRPRGGGQPRYVHSLNGSGVAVGRALVAVLETYQNADGSVTVPEVLLPYMGGIRRLETA